MDTMNTINPSEPEAANGMDPRITRIDADAQHEAAPACPAVAAAGAPAAAPEGMLRIGIDVGSTTVKFAILDPQNKILYAIYRRHHADVRATVVEVLEEACAKYGERIVVGIDAKDGIVAVEGWGESGNVGVIELAQKMKDAGVKTIIYTDISRDGTLSGVNVDATVKLAQESGVKIVASGGVKSLEDIKALKKQEAVGIEGVIAGKSIYMGTLDLAAAIKIAKE
jgi:uncharacterized protein related to proFAR isomerase